MAEQIRLVQLIGYCLNGHKFSNGVDERRARVQRAAMLAAILTGESPVGGNYPVATVAITGDGAGDQTVESPVVKILEGWV